MKNLVQDPWAVFNWLWVIIIVGVPIMCAIWIVQTHIKLTNDGKRLEASLNTVYLEAQNYLSHSIMLIRETLQINKREAETLERALSDAITGRYTNATSREVMYNFLHESYPDLNAFNTSFDRIDSAVSSSRSAFTQMQNKLLYELKAFEQWRTGTFMARLLLKDRFPDNDLIARVGGVSYKGQQALEKMYQIIQTSEGLESYNKGTHEPMQLY